MRNLECSTVWSKVAATHVLLRITGTGPSLGKLASQEIARLKVWPEAPADATVLGDILLPVMPPSDGS